MVTTLAGTPGQSGSTDGTGAAARFVLPASVAVDDSGNIYVADSLGANIRKITQAGVVTTFAGAAGQPGLVDGTGAAARFVAPIGITVDSTGNLFVIDAIARLDFRAVLRKVTPAGAVTTLPVYGEIGGVAESSGTLFFTTPTAVFVATLN